MKLQNGMDASQGRHVQKKTVEKSALLPKVSVDFFL
jgi:hypothetical protein